MDFWDTDKPATEVNGTGMDNYEEALFTERVFKVLNEHTIKPLFLYFAPDLVHAPLQVPRRYLDNLNVIGYQPRRSYHAMVQYLDDVMENLTKGM